MAVRFVLRRLASLGFEYLLYFVQEFAIGKRSEELMLAVSASMKMFCVNSLTRTAGFTACEQVDEFIL